MSRQMKGNLILLLTAFVWGMGFVSQSLGMEYIGPFTFNCLRNIIASLFLIPCIYFLQKISGEKTPERFHPPCFTKASYCGILV